MSASLPKTWQDFLTAANVDPALWQVPLDKADQRRKNNTVFPPENLVFRAFELTPPEKVRIVILGQDPYHDDGQAEGLAFSVPDGVPLPPSLRNIYKEFTSDLNIPAPASGHLGHWAEKGVLLINAVLSVDAHTPGSHSKLGWELFTDSVIRALSAQKDKLVFILWGAYAIKKAALIDSSKHLIITSVHPSPLSASRGFFGSRPFSRTEEFFEGTFHW